MLKLTVNRSIPLNYCVVVNGQPLQTAVNRGAIQMLAMYLTLCQNKKDVDLEKRVLKVGCLSPLLVNEYHAVRRLP